MSYQTSPQDCNRYIKALIEAAQNGQDLKDIHDQFNIPIKYATDYIKRVAYLINSNNQDLEKVTEVLNYEIDYMDQLSTDELRKFVRNQNNFNQVLELRDIIYDEPIEKHNTQEDQRKDDSDSMSNNQPTIGNDSQDGHNNYNQRRTFNPGANKKEKDEYVKKTRDELMRESASAEQYSVPQFKTRKDLLKWILDRISYLQKTKIDDFMLFFVSDEEHFMNNPDQMYILMFNHLGKHAADIAYERFKRMLGNLPPDQGFYHDNNYPPGMGMDMGMGYGMPGMMPGMGMPGMGAMGMPGTNGSNRNGPQVPYQAANPQMYYVIKGVLPPMIDYRSPEGQMLVWEYEKKQAEDKEREEKRRRFREDMQDQMDYKLQNFMDPDKLAMMNGGGNNNNNAQAGISQALIAAGTHMPSYINNPDGTTSMIAIPKQNNGGQNGEMNAVTNIYTQLIQTMKTINDTVIQNLTKPDEYKTKIVDLAFNNMLTNMDPLTNIEKMKGLMESFQPPIQQGNNIRDVIDTANYMLQSKKLDYDAKFVDKQQEREDRRWQFEVEQKHREEQESKNNTISLIKTFTELLPNAIGPLLQIISLVKGGGGAAGAAGGLGGLGNLLGGLMGGGAQNNGQQGGAGGIDMNEIMSMAQNMLGGMGMNIPGMGGAATGGGGPMSQGPFGNNGGQSSPMDGYIPNSSPNSSPAVDPSKFSPYFRQHVQNGAGAGVNEKFMAPPSETWSSDFTGNTPAWTGNDYQQPVQETVYQEFRQDPSNPGNSQVITATETVEPQGPLSFDESDFESKELDELNNYMNDIQATKESLVNAERTVLNVISKKRAPKPTIDRSAFNVPEKTTIIEAETIKDENNDGIPETITDTVVQTTEPESNSDNSNKSSILGDIRKRADDSVDSIL